MLDIGDATLHFLGDTTQLDQAFARVNAGVAESITPAAAQVEGLGAAFTQTGAQATSAGAQVAASAVELKAAQTELRATLAAVTAAGGDTAVNMDLLAQAEVRVTLATAAAKDAQAALRTELLAQSEASTILGEASVGLTNHLAGMFGIIAAAEGLKSLIEGVQHSVLELDLLSQKTGINISTLAGLEHVSKETGVGFEAVSTALIRLSRAQVLAIEGGKAQITAFERIGISVAELKSLTPEEMFFRVAEAMANTQNHAEASASAFALLGRGGAALIPIFAEGKDKLKEMVDEAARSSGVTAEAGAAARDWEAQTANLSQAFRAGLIPVMEVSVPIIKLLETEARAVWAAFRDVGTVIMGLSLLFKDDVVGMGTIMDDVVHGNLSKAVADAKVIEGTMMTDWANMTTQLKKNFQDAADFTKQVWKEAKPFKPVEDDLSDLHGKTKDATSQLVAESKRALEEQLANIEKWKAEQKQAYAEGKTDAADWQVAEVQAAKASAIAHEDYLAKVVAIYQRFGETRKAQAAQQELATLQIKDAAKETEKLAAAEEKHHAAALKIVDTYQKLVEAGIDKNFAATAKAAEQLATAEDKLRTAHTALDLENSAKPLKEREEAIKQLASMQLITEQQKAQKLITLYNEEEKAAIDALTKQLADEQKARDAAQAKIKFAESAEGNPFFTDAQVLELKKNLALAETAYLKTQDQISKTEDKFEKQRLALQKDAIGQAIALATAAGNQQLALDLKQHQAALIALKDKIDLAKASGTYTSAMKEEQKELNNTTNALVKEAVQIGTLRQAWDIFSNDFQKKAKTDETVAQQMATSFLTATQGLETGIQGAFSAMITGTESAGQAIEKAAFKTIGAIAQQWGSFFLAKAIADVFWNPPAAAAELAAGVALEALAGVMGGLGSASSKSTGTAAAAKTITPNASTAPAAQQPTTTVTNVPLLSGGGLVSHQTLAIVGDAPGGGDQREAVIPLNDVAAMRQIVQAFAKASGEGSGGGIVNNFRIGGMISTTDLTKVARMITRGAQTGRLRMSVSNSNRVTRKV